MNSNMVQERRRTVKKMCSCTQLIRYLFNWSLNSGIFPTRWKDRYISPVFKSGDTADLFVLNKLAREVTFFFATKVFNDPNELKKTEIMKIKAEIEKFVRNAY